MMYPCMAPPLLPPLHPLPPPPSHQNKVFIFRGHQYEKLHDFNTRLAVQFPNAKVRDHSQWNLQTICLVRWLKFLSPSPSPSPPLPRLSCY